MELAILMVLNKWTVEFRLDQSIQTRISTLIISNPDTSDSGNYTCRVEGTNTSAVIELLVAGTQPTGELHGLGVF